MAKSKLAIFFDTFVVVIIIFVLSYFWTTRLSKNAFLGLFVSLLLSFLVFILIFKHSIKKYKLDKITFRDQKLSKICFQKLRFMPTNNLIQYMEKLLNSKHISNNIFKNENSYFYVSVKTTLSEKDFFSALEHIENLNESCISFICLSADDNFIKLANEYANEYNKNINVFMDVDLFLIMKENNMYPENTNVETKKQKKITALKKKFSSSINRFHFKEFFFSGLSLIVLSMIIPFSTYYLVFGSVLLLLALISLFFKGNKNKTTTKTKTLLELTKDVTRG